MTPLVVLVVDDNDLLLSLVGRILDTAGIAVLQAGSAADALRLWQDSPIPIDMLITDIEMPGKSGFALADQLTLDRPDLPVLFMSGSYRHDPRLRDRLGRRSAFLEKPFTEQSLLAEVFELAAQPIRRASCSAG
jgi:CheY-like chemotaxis protein